MPQVGVLGPLTVDGDGARLPPRERAMLTVLAVRRGAVVSADTLADAWWREQPPPTWPKAVQSSIVQLRKVLGAAAIETRPQGYCLVVPADDVDAYRFTRQLDRARELLAAGEPDRAAYVADQALALWRGQPLLDAGEWEAGSVEAGRLEDLRLDAEELRLDANLQAGHYDRVLAEAQARVAEQPLRERRWALLALAQYQAGRQGDALRTLRRARAVLLDELGVDPGPDIVALEQAILNQDPSLVAAQLPEPAPVCPYLGLVPYDVGDAETFFGRQDDVVECLRRLAERGALAVVGPSGSGKSSLVRAGVAAALEREGRQVVIVVPGAQPTDALAPASAAGSRPALLVDQCEQAVTLCDDPGERARFFDALADHAETAPLVIALRADRLGELSAHPRFAGVAERGLYLLKGMDEAKLREAIEGPARQAGWLLEPGLVDLLVRDVEGEPGALPLLSHALRQTWQRREGRTLTVAGYQASGGIRGAVAQSAEQLYEQAPAEQRAMLRDLLLRLVAPTPDGDPVRSRVPRRAVATDAAHEELIERLVSARLVTSDEEAVELAHEALARAWPRLRSWLEEDVEGQHTWRHLAAAASSWEAMGEPDSELYRGVRLARAVEWRGRAGPDLNATEQRFLAASRQLAKRERQAARRRRRTVTSILASAAAVAIGLGAIAVVQADRATSERDRALDAEAEARLEALVNRSLALRSTDRAVAALLAVEAHLLAPGDARTHSVLLATFTDAPGFVGYRHVPVDSAPLFGALVAGTSSVVIAEDGRDLLLYDLETGEVQRPFGTLEATGVTAPDPAFSTVRVSPDGRWAVQLVETGTADECLDLDLLRRTNNAGCAALLVYDIASGELVLGPVTPPFGPGDVAINADGSLVAVAGGFDGDVAVYRTRDGEQLGTLDGLPRPAGADLRRDTATVTFSSDDRLYLGSMAGTIRVVDPATLEIVDELDAPEMALQPAITDDGLLVGNGIDTLFALDTASGELRWSLDIAVPGDPEPCGFLAVAAAIGRLYCGNSNGILEERELATGQRTGRRLDPQLGSVGELAVSADGAELVALGGDAAVISHWRLDGGGPIVEAIGPGMGSNGYDPSGELLMVYRGTRTTLQDTISPTALDFAVWDPATGEIVDELDGVLAGAWARPGLLGVIWADGSPGFYDVIEHARVEGPGSRGQVGQAALSADGSRLYVGSQLPGVRRCEWVAIDMATLRFTEFLIELDACDVTTLPSTGGSAVGRYFALTGPEPEGWTTRFYDADTGQQLDGELVGPFAVLVGGDGKLLAGYLSGEIVEYDIDTLEPLGAFPGARGAVERFALSNDGRVLLATSLNQTVTLYDVATRTQLGDAVATDVPLTAGNGGPPLRPDGNAFVINSSAGLAIWNIEPDRLAVAACGLAGRNLTRAEWDTYLANAGDFHATCPDLGTAAGQ